jgi:peroxiredoxin Q/BCP
VCSLRDAATDFGRLGVQVYGVSLDDVAALADFVKAQRLSFPLLSDPDGSAAGKYGVLMENRPMSKRVTFVLDEHGALRHVDEKVDVSTHGADVVKLIEKLRG